MANTINLAVIGDLLPKTFVSDVIDTTRAQSVVSKLSPSEAMQFGTSNILTLGNRPRAEFVGESAQKSATDISFGSFQITPKKAQVTVRLTQEVEWANPQARLDVIDIIKRESSAALTEALDLGILHRLNPLTGTETSWTEYVRATTNKFAEAAGTDVDRTLDQAVRALQAKNVNVNGLGMTGNFLAGLAGLENAATGLPRYDLGYATSIDAFKGLSVAVSPTIIGHGTDGAKLGTYTAAENIEAIVGDFRDGIRWGVQKIVPAEVIEYGDPDGKGDLKRTNEFALRVEIVYGWKVFADKFALVTKPAA